MSRVSSFSIMIFILFILSIASSLPYTYDHSTPEEIENCSTRRIITKRGVLCGRVKDLIVKQRGTANYQFLRPVEQYLGIPYASPPVGELRFMPPGSAPKWSGTKMAMNFGPVCPQKFPNTVEMRPERKNYFDDLRKYLRNESEDCLYLNVYAPFQDADKRNHFPVMVFLHGESFEWGSGNPYDGSVLASYGRVIVVTLNFRLGILGFLNANFGLVDQIAALLWVQENIEAFGGDPNRVTLFGHGTGAACASLLMLSPMVQSGEGNKLLFQRAILMGGTALSDWALAKEWHVVYQVSSAFNCPVGPDFLSCLGKKRLTDLTNFTPQTQQYATRFGPVVDGRVVPNNSLEKLMTTYNDLFSRFDLLLGTSEVESLHLLNSVALTHGLLEKELLEALRNYLTPYCEMNVELCINRTLEEYKDEQETNEERAIIARNTLLDILSDSRTVAPLLLTAKHHAPLNPDTETFFYVFAHRTASKAYIRDQTYHGEELPYVFGVPLVESSFHFTDYYTEQEQLLSEAIMTYWSNFAYGGNPNVPEKFNFNTLTPMDWRSFRVDWPNFEKEEQQFLFLAYPPIVSQRYRSKQMRYWQEVFPNMRKNYTIYISPTRRPKPTNRFNDFPKQLFHPTPISSYMPKTKELASFTRTPEPEVFGKVVLSPEDSPPGNIESPSVGQTTQRSGWTRNTLIILGGVFLAANLILFLALYYKCANKKKSDAVVANSDDPINIEEDSSKAVPHFNSDGCNFIGMIVKASKSEVVKAAEDASSSKAKLTRNISSSTLDAHTKVREWITQEIVQKCSPAFLRRSRDTEQTNLSRIKPPLIRTDSKTVESSSTLGRSPTRPVSPAGETSQKTKVVPQLTLKKSLEKYSKSDTPKLSTHQLLDKTKRKHRADKVSVAIDATPAGRGSSVMRQQPIELTKSLDCTSSGIDKEVPLRRSVTLDNISSSPPTKKKVDQLRKSATSVNIQYKQLHEPTVVKIMHFHSKSDPVQDLYNFTPPPKLKTFAPETDVNVTSRDDSLEKESRHLTPEQALMTIKRRNFPKVLPDLPSRQAIAHKRRSMPAPNSLVPTLEGKIYNRSPSGKPHLRLAPLPPPRTSSALARQGSTPSPICQSAPVLAMEPPVAEEPELTCNNLYFGPLKLSREKLKKSEIKSPQEIYESIKPQRPTEPKPEIKALARTVVTTDPERPIKRVEPKIIIKPKISRNMSKSTGIPRVTATDNATYVNISDLKPQQEENKSSASSMTLVKTEQCKERVARPSHIPTKVKSDDQCANNGSSSSESTTPSEESDTGTVVKKN